ncbi:MAG: tetratricopeptide repeat protein, partial [Myxococcota bacterium]
AWREPRLEAEIDLASIYIQQGRHDEVISLLERLSEEFETLDRRGKQADALQRLGWTLVRLGEHDRAEEVLERAHALYESESYLRGQGWCRFSLGGSFKQRGELDRAEVLLTEATDIFEETGDRQGLAEGINGLAEVQRQRGHLDEAEANYRRAHAIWKSIGAAAAAVARLNLALVALDRRDIDQATRRFDASARHFRAKTRPALELFAQLGLLACYAARDDVPRATETLRRVDLLLEDVTYVDTDLANPARIAGEYFFDARRDDLALRALTISRHQFSQLGHEAPIEDIDEMIEVIESRGPSR